jgi:hypothetical protein
MNIRWGDVNVPDHHQIILLLVLLEKFEIVLLLGVTFKHLEEMSIPLLTSGVDPSVKDEFWVDDKGWILWEIIRIPIALAYRWNKRHRSFPVFYVELVLADQSQNWVLNAYFTTQEPSFEFCILLVRKAIVACQLDFIEDAYFVWKLLIGHIPCLCYLDLTVFEHDFVKEKLNFPFGWLTIKSKHLVDVPKVFQYAQFRQVRHVKDWSHTWSFSIDSFENLAWLFELKIDRNKRR